VVQSIFILLLSSCTKDVIWASIIAHKDVFLRYLTVKNLLHGAWRSMCQARGLYNSKVILQVSLSPQVFRRMLKLPEPMLTFKGEDCRDLLKRHNNGLDLLPEYLENLASILEDITRIQVNSFKNPFPEIAWLFTRLTGQESTATISHMILYILYFIVK
jgi:hypothetical protein